MNERRIARVVLAVDVWRGVEPGINTIDAHEPPYEYLVVRNVEEMAAYSVGDPGALVLVALDDFPDHDPDDLIRSELMTSLTALHKERA